MRSHSLDIPTHRAFHRVIFLLYVSDSVSISSVLLPHNTSAPDWPTVCAVWSSPRGPSVFRPFSIWLCGSGTKSEA